MKKKISEQRILPAVKLVISEDKGDNLSKRYKILNLVTQLRINESKTERINIKISYYIERFQISL